MENKRPFYLVIIALLVLTNFVFLVSVGKLSRELKQIQDVGSVIGTYCTSPVGTHDLDAEYLVFFSDYRYVRYIIGHPFAEEGTYERDGEFLVLSHDEDSKNLLIKGNTIFDVKMNSNLFTPFFLYSAIPGIVY